MNFYRNERKTHFSFYSANNSANCTIRQSEADVWGLKAVAAFPSFLLVAGQNWLTVSLNCLLKNKSSSSDELVVVLRGQNWMCNMGSTAEPKLLCCPWMWRTLMSLSPLLKILLPPWVASIPGMWVREHNLLFLQEKFLGCLCIRHIP